MRMNILSLKIGNVVRTTNIEQRKVVIGSAITKSLSIIIIIAAMTTPIDWIISPRIWIKAALTFKLALTAFVEGFILSDGMLGSVVFENIGIWIFSAF